MKSVCILPHLIISQTIIRMNAIVIVSMTTQNGAMMNVACHATVRKIIQKSVTMNVESHVIAKQIIHKNATRNADFHVIVN